MTCFRKGLGKLAAFYIPQADRAVSVGGSERPPIAAETHVGRSTAMPNQPIPLLDPENGCLQRGFRSCLCFLVHAEQGLFDLLCGRQAGQQRVELSVPVEQLLGGCIQAGDRA